jgi:hypothetical protein
VKRYLAIGMIIIVLLNLVAISGAQECKPVVEGYLNELKNCEIAPSNNLSRFSDCNADCNTTLEELWNCQYNETYRSRLNASYDSCLGIYDSFSKSFENSNEYGAAIDIITAEYNFIQYHCARLGLDCDNYSKSLWGPYTIAINGSIKFLESKINSSTKDYEKCPWASTVANESLNLLSEFSPVIKRGSLPDDPKELVESALQKCNICINLCELPNQVQNTNLAHCYEYKAEVMSTYNFVINSTYNESYYNINREIAELYENASNAASHGPTQLDNESKRLYQIAAERWGIVGDYITYIPRDNRSDEDYVNSTNAYRKSADLYALIDNQSGRLDSLKSSLAVYQDSLFKKQIELTSYLGSYILFIFVLFIMLYLILQLFFKSIKVKIDNSLDNFLEKDTLSTIVEVAITVWVGFIFARVLYPQLIQSVSDINTSLSNQQVFDLISSIAPFAISTYNTPVSFTYLAIFILAIFGIRTAFYKEKKPKSHVLRALFVIFIVFLLLDFVEAFALLLYQTILIPVLFTVACLAVLIEFETFKNIDLSKKRNWLFGASAVGILVWAINYFSHTIPDFYSSLNGVATYIILIVLLSIVLALGHLKIEGRSLKAESVKKVGSTVKKHKS